MLTIQTMAAIQLIKRIVKDFHYKYKIYFSKLDLNVSELIQIPSLFCVFYSNTNAVFLLLLFKGYPLVIYSAIQKTWTK